MENEHDLAVTAEESAREVHMDLGFAAGKAALALLVMTALVLGAVYGWSVYHRRKAEALQDRRQACYEAFFTADGGQKYLKLGCNLSLQEQAEADELRKDRCLGNIPAKDQSAFFNPCDLIPSPSEEDRARSRLQQAADSDCITRYGANWVASDVNFKSPHGRDCRKADVFDKATRDSKNAGK